jgi:hypothetical protein
MPEQLNQRTDELKINDFVFSLFTTAHFFKLSLVRRINGTFGFIQYFSQPLAESKELVF